MGGRSSCRTSDFVRRRRWICRDDQAAARLLAQNHQRYYELSQSSAERMATSAAQGSGDMPVHRREGANQEAQAAPGELTEQPHGQHCLLVGCHEEPGRDSQAMQTSIRCGCCMVQAHVRREDQTGLHRRHQAGRLGLLLDVWQTWPAFALMCRGIYEQHCARVPCSCSWAPTTVTSSLPYCYSKHARECADVQGLQLSRAAAGGIPDSILLLPTALHGGLSGRHILQTCSCCCADASAAKAAGQAAEALLANSLALQATE